ncbi:AsmA family protein [Oceanibaculum indicum]|uniref:AsmA-like protein n=1 Tax=Oceanibaculum indicum TaxID=526216 RepID=A0A420WAT5_9PROT|nr:AsmA family protein [Oceanibaculum indicum]RKQ68129.1 AsmA-like protein [Oceanibaculum indicum]
MRRVLIGLGVVAVVLLAAVFLVPSLVDWNGYKPRIAEAVREATGRDLVIDGNIGLSILPTPTLSVGGVRLRNLEGASSPDLVRVKALDVEVALRPLLTGDIEVKRLVLVEPFIALEELPDGRRSWDFTVPQQASDIPDETAGDSAFTGDGGTSVTLDDVRIENGTLLYRSADGAEQRFDKLSLSLNAQSLQGPYQAKGNLAYQGVPATIEASVGRIGLPGKPAPVYLNLGLADRGTLVLSGAMQGGAEPRLTGKLELDSPDVLALAATASRGEAALPLLRQPGSLRATLSATPQAVALDDMRLALGEAQATGAVNIRLEGTPSVDAVLEVGRFDLDRMMAAQSGAGAAQRSGQRQGQAQGQGQPSQAQQAGQAIPFALPAIPAGVNLTLDLTVDAIDYRGRLVRQVRGNVAVQDGRLALNQLSAQLPGGAEASLYGVATSGPSGTGMGDSGTRFEGSAELTATSMRDLAVWLQLGLPDVPAERLRSLSLQTDLVVDSSELRLANLDLRVDASKLAGSASYRFAGRPFVGLSLSLDRINLDGYAVQPPALLPGPVVPEQMPRTNNEPPPPPLEFLKSFDAEVKLTVGHVTLRGQQLRDINLDATVRDGVAYVREAAVADFAGARVGLGGTLTAREGASAGDLGFKLEAREPARLLQLLNVPTVPNPAQLGRLELSGRLAGTPEAFDIDTTLTAAGGQVKVTGGMALAQFPPKIDLVAEGSHPDFGKLLKTLLGRDPEAGPALEDFRLWLTAKSGDTDAMAVNGRIEAAGGMFTMEGDVNPFAPSPTFALALDLRHGNAVRFLRIFAPDYRPGGTRDRPLEVTGRLAGNAAAFTLGDLKLRAGTVEATGNAAISLSAARPKITAKLDAGEIQLEPWLPDPARGGGDARPTPPIPLPVSGGGWSAEPLRLTALRSVDAELTATARTVLYDAYRVEDVLALVTLQDGVLDISKINGAMFGGSIGMNGRLVAADMPTVRAEFQVRNADLRAATTAAGQPPRVRGLLDFDMQVNGRGQSEAAMVSSLAGNGRFAVREGVAEGFDLQSISDRLEELNDAAAFLTLARAAFAGGETPFERLDGSFTITDGVARTEDTQLVASAGEGKVTGIADLPRQQVDATAAFTLTRHPSAPPFSATITGPLADPAVNLRTRELEAFLVQRAVERGLMRLLPPQQQDSSGTQTAPASPATPADKLRQIIPELLKR